jgi:hypothetical protein
VPSSCPASSSTSWCDPLGTPRHTRVRNSGVGSTRGGGWAHHRARARASDQARRWAGIAAPRSGRIGPATCARADRLHATAAADFPRRPILVGAQCACAVGYGSGGRRPTEPKARGGLELARVRRPTRMNWRHKSVEAMGNPGSQAGGVSASSRSGGSRLRRTARHRPAAQVPRESCAASRTSISAATKPVGGPASRRRIKTI